MFLLFTSNNGSASRSRIELGKQSMGRPHPNDFKADFVSKSTKNISEVSVS